MTPEEFDSLGIFVAVVEELRKEPFFSEDNHERLTGDIGFFCHPAFLKSAVFPFRKIWMPTERCAFRKRDGTGGIRDLVYRDFSDRKLLDGHHYWFYESFETQLAKPPDFGGTNESNQEIINLWLNAQIAHTGAKNPDDKKPWEPEMADFDKCATRIGREKFEFLFRTILRVFGSVYIGFEETLAFPLFRELQTEQGMKPSFEAAMALKYNPYPSSTCKIIFDDVFWHLNRETMEETFERLLARQYFSGLQSFLRGLFPSKSRRHSPAFANLKRSTQCLKRRKQSRWRKIQKLKDNYYVVACSYCPSVTLPISSAVS